MWFYDVTPFVKELDLENNCTWIGLIGGNQLHRVVDRLVSYCLFSAQSYMFKLRNFRAIFLIFLVDRLFMQKANACSLHSHVYLMYEPRNLRAHFFLLGLPDLIERGEFCKVGVKGGFTRKKYKYKYKLSFLFVSCTRFYTSFRREM